MGLWMHPWNPGPSWLRRWRICLQCRRPGFHPWVGKIPWRRAWQPTPVFLPGESMHRGAWRATVHGVTELNMTEHRQKHLLSNFFFWCGQFLKSWSSFLQYCFCFWFFCFFFFWSQGMWDVCSPSRDEPAPLHWKWGVLSPGPPGKLLSGF